MNREAQQGKAVILRYLPELLKSLPYAIPAHTEPFHKKVKRESEKTLLRNGDA